MLFNQLIRKCDSVANRLIASVANIASNEKYFSPFESLADATICYVPIKRPGLLTNGRNGVLKNCGLQVVRQLPASDCGIDTFLAFTPYTMK